MFLVERTDIIVSKSDETVDDNPNQVSNDSMRIIRVSRLKAGKAMPIGFTTR